MRKQKLIAGILVLLVVIFSSTCKKDDDEKTKSNLSEILSFKINAQLDSAIINKETKQITIVVKYDTDLSSLTPTVTISDKASISPASGEKIDFSKGSVTYVVTAEDQSTSEWSVTVTKAAEITKNLISFSVANQKSITITDTLITIVCTPEADLKKIIPTIEVSPNTTIEPASGATLDFSQSPLTFTLAATDGSKKTFKVSITKLAYIDKKLISFAVENQQSIDITDSLVTIVCKAEADLKKIIPTIEVSANTTVEPASGSSVDFSKGPVTFTIKATDGSTKSFKVSVTRELYTENLIKSFAIENAVSTKILGTKIQVVMPYGTNIASLNPMIDISAGAIVSPASGSNIDFSKGDVNFTVTSETGVAKVYTVILSAPLPLVAYNDPRIVFTGRVDKTPTTCYKFSAPGAYVMAKFKGTECEFEISSETSQNYIEVVIDNVPSRILVSSSRKIYKAATGLPDGEHTILICKDTEAAMGSINFYGFRCVEMLTLDVPTRKIEFYGNSITCGASMITGELCNKADNWNASNKAYASYGALTARALNARWQLTSVSGIGLIHSCCNMTNTMPTTYDRLYLEKSNSVKWDFSNYMPDVVTLCLGQNDGTANVQSEDFKNAYVTLIKNLRAKYPTTTFMLLTSPMADITLFNAMSSSIDAVIAQLALDGESEVYKVELPYNLTHGCNSHPDESEHVQISEVLQKAIKDKMGW